MSFNPSQPYQFGALYTHLVRDRHRYHGVPIRETKGFLESVFYISDNSPEERGLIRDLEALVARVRALDEAELREERAALRAKQARRLRRRNLWRRVTFRKPLR